MPADGRWDLTRRLKNILHFRDKPTGLWNEILKQAKTHQGL